MEIGDFIWQKRCVCKIVRKKVCSVELEEMEHVTISLPQTRRSHTRRRAKLSVTMTSLLYGLTRCSGQVMV